MKIILSRKGFDCKAGGGPSPILDEEIISFPIPETNGGKIKYSDIFYNHFSLGKLIDDLATRKMAKGTHLATKDSFAHLDPWIDKRIKFKNKNTNLEAFGPNASKWIAKEKINKGDLYLFFGWFRHAYEKNGTYYWMEDSLDYHLIWGYMQVGEVLNKYFPDEIKDHPHYCAKNEKADIIMRAAKNLTSLGSKLDGGGVFRFDKKRVLTLDNEFRRSYWDLERFPFLRKIISQSKAQKSHAFCKRGRWQELVIDIGDDNKLLDVVKKIF